MLGFTVGARERVDFSCYLLPPSVSHHFFFFFRFGAQDVYFEHGSSKTRIEGKRPQALKARGKLLSFNFPNAKKKMRISTILLFSIRPSNGSALILPLRTVT